MKTLIKLIIICLLLCLLGINSADAQSLCNDIPIDDFSSSSVSPISVDESEPLVEVVDDGGSGAIGRFRSITLERLEGVIPSDGATLNIQANFISLSNDAAVRSRANILYNADGAGLGLDLSDRELLRLFIASLDSGIDLTYILTDENTNQASLVVAASEISDPVVTFLFEDFIGIQNLDLSSIDSVELIIESATISSDAALEAVSFGCQGSLPPESVAVPVMSRSGYMMMAMLLLLLGLFWTKQARGYS